VKVVGWDGNGGARERDRTKKKKKKLPGGKKAARPAGERLQGYRKKEGKTGTPGGKAGGAKEGT